MGRSYTWGSPEGVQAVITEVEGMLIPYAMTLNAGDMEALIRALAYVANSDACEGDGGNPSEHHEDDGYRQCHDTCWLYRATDLLGTIAESVHVDWV